jgi:hypothetical protein
VRLGAPIKAWGAFPRKSNVKAPQCADENKPPIRRRANHRPSEIRAPKEPKSSCAYQRDAILAAAGYNFDAETASRDQIAPPSGRLSFPLMHFSAAFGTCIRVSHLALIESPSKLAVQVASAVAEYAGKTRPSKIVPAQEASAIARRKAIHEELHPETKHGGNGGPSGQFGHTDKTAFASASSDAIGKSERDVRRAAARGEALGDDLNDITGTSLDKGIECLKIDYQ